MKWYHAQKTKSLGLVAAITIVGAASLNCAICLAEDKTDTFTQQVEFTFNPMLKFETKSTSLEVENLIPGAAKTSTTPAELTISTNNASGYYISVGAIDRTTLDRKEGGEYKIDSLPTTPSNVTYDNVRDLPLNTWGLACSTGSSDNLNASKFFGLTAAPETPTREQAEAMQRAIDVNAPTGGNSTVYCGLGVRAGNTLPQGTYTGSIKFYAVVK